MINHARTLLLNKSGAMRPPVDYFLEEYIPEDFTPVVLTGGLVRAHDVLIGRNADKAFENYRAWSLMRILHSTELASYVTALDPRVTYLRERDVTRLYGTSALARNGAATGVAVYQVGTPTATFSGQKIHFRWVVTATDPNSVQILDMEAPGEMTTTVSGSSNLTNPVSLPNQPTMDIRIGAYPLPTGASWEVSTLIAPTEDMSELVTKLESSGADVLADVLGSSTAEPYATCKDIWDTSALTMHRLAAFTLAFIYRVEAVRTRG